MSNKGLLIVISGPSGAGKGTICKELLRRKESDIEISISATTRKPRVGETHGVSYFFKDKEEFTDMINNNEFIEYAKVYDNFYGTPKKYVFDKLEEGKDVILEIDIQGAMKVKQNYKDAVFIFILPPSLDELKHRITGRGTETEEDIKKRMKSAYDEICQACRYDYAIVNDNVDDAVHKANCIITAEKCRLNKYQINFEVYKEE